MIEAVLFDLDGTLIYLPINYDKMFEEFSRIMETTEVRPLTEKISKLDDAKRKRIFEVWEKFELSALDDMTVNKEGLALYQKFSKLPKALVTMQSKTLVNNVLKILGLSFNAVVTREDSLNRVEQLKIATQKLKVDFDKIVFVGNTEDDALAAKIVNCQFLRVSE